jgi:glycosyltransferase involved in cell wall biosynthesis
VTETGRRFSIVCLSPQEWRVALPTNRQQIMRRAAARGHEVLFVETSHFLGGHLLRLVREDARRSLLRRLLASEPVTPGITAAKAVNLAPWGHKLAPACRLNNALTARRLRRLVAALPQPAVGWLYDPCAAGLAARLDVAFTVYDCVDDYAEQTRGDARRRALVTAADRSAAGLSRVVFATSRTQQRRLAALNANTHLVPNVGDHAHFAPAAERSLAAPEVLALPRPVIGFAGNMLPGKVDFELLERLARARPEWTFLLVGPVPVPEHVRTLRTFPNVHMVGARPYGELPRYVAGFDVGLIPYVANDYTRSCFPLKLYEYLAAGKPVVATGLPELAEMEPDVVLAADDETLLAAVERGLAARSAADIARRTEIASRNTWETRATTLLDLVAAELAR